MWLTDRELVDSDWLTADGLLLAAASVGWSEGRLWGRGDMVLGLSGTLGVVGTKLLAAAPHWLLCCLSL